MPVVHTPFPGHDHFERLTCVFTAARPPKNESIEMDIVSHNRIFLCLSLSAGLASLAYRSKESVESRKGS
jgi:hypothetical protein